VLNNTAYIAYKTRFMFLGVLAVLHKPVESRKVEVRPSFCAYVYDNMAEVNIYFAAIILLEYSINHVIPGNC
jgi:hypothetical protein